MSFLVFSGNTPFAQSHPDYRQWERQSQEIITLYDIEDIPGKTPGLFFDAPGLLFILESIKAGQLREIFYRAEETGENVCIISEKKPRGNFDKDGIKIVDVSYPGSMKKRTELLCSVSGISKNQAAKIASTYDDPYQAYIVSRQCNFVDSTPEWSQFFIPEDKDSPPWLITDAINTGNTQEALKQTRTLLRKKKVTPQSLSMQLTGYYTKVSTSATGFFAKLNRMHLKDRSGMISDMAYYPSVIFQAGKLSASHSLQAYVASLSSRCQ